eukprot:Pgem_evm3s17142
MNFLCATPIFVLLFGCAFGKYEFSQEIKTNYYLVGHQLGKCIMEHERLCIDTDSGVYVEENLCGLYCDLPCFISEEVVDKSNCQLPNIAVRAHQRYDPNVKAKSLTPCEQELEYNWYLQKFETNQKLLLLASTKEQGRQLNRKYNGSNVSVLKGGVKEVLGTTKNAKDYVYAFGII